MSNQTVSKQALLAWDHVFALPPGERMLIAVRAADVVMEERGSTMIDMGLDDSIECRRRVYLLAVRGDGAIGALSRAAEAIGLGFAGSIRTAVSSDFAQSPLAAASSLSHHDLSDVGAALAGDATNFTAQLLRLIAKADPLNRERLRVAYPEAVAAWEQWHRSSR